MLTIIGLITSDLNFKPIMGLLIKCNNIQIFIIKKKTFVTVLPWENVDPISNLNGIAEEMQRQLKQ